MAQLEEAQALLQTAKTTVAELESKATAGDETAKASVEAAKAEVSRVERDVAYYQALNDRDQFKTRVEEQERVITHLSTTQATIDKRKQEGVEKAAGGYKARIAELQDKLKDDPDGAFRGLLETIPQILQEETQKTRDTTLTAAKSMYENLAAIDKLRSEPQYAHLKPHEGMISARVAVLIDQGRDFQSALRSAMDEADAIYKQGAAKAAPPPPTPPPPGATGAELSGTPGPKAKPQEILPTLHEELASREKAQSGKVL